MQIKKSKGYENIMILILFAATGCVMAIRFGITNTFAYIGDIAMTPAQVGLVMSAHAMAWAISSLVLGLFAGVLKKQKLFLIVGLILSSVLSGCIGMVHSMQAVVILRVLIGICQGPLIPLLQTVAREVSSPERMGLNQGCLIAGTSLLGQSLPGALIPSIAAKSETAWRMPIIIIGVIGVVTAIAVLAGYPGKKREKARAAERKERTSSEGTLSKKEVLELFKIKNFNLAMVGAVGAIGWTLCLTSFAATYMEVETNATTARLSTIIAVGGFAAMISNILLPGLSDKIGRKKCYIVCACGMILAPLVLILFRNQMDTPLPVILYAIGQLLGACAMSLGTYVIVGESVPAHLVTIGYSICLCMGELLGGTAGPAIAGILANTNGYIAGVAFAAGFGVVCLIVAFFFKETLKKKEE